MTSSWKKPQRSVTGRGLAGLVALLFVSGCAGTTVTPIKTLLDDADRFDGKSVRVVGDVQSSMGVLGVGTYQMNDGSGTIRIVSESGGAPREGAHVGVAGKFRSGFTLGSETLAVIVESERFTP